MPQRHSGDGYEFPPPKKAVTMNTEAPFIRYSNRSSNLDPPGLDDVYDIDRASVRESKLSLLNSIKRESLVSHGPPGLSADYSTGEEKKKVFVRTKKSKATPISPTSLVKVVRQESHKGAFGDPNTDSLCKAVCAGCNKILVEGVVFVMDGNSNRFHEGCFKCLNCQKVIDDPQYREIEGGVQCIDCGLPECHYCDNLILGDVAVAYAPDGSKLEFHTQCLRCIKCQSLIIDKYKTGIDGFICEACYNPRCKQCDGIISEGTQYFLKVDTRDPICIRCHHQRNPKGEKTIPESNMLNAHNFGSGKGLNMIASGHQFLQKIPLQNILKPIQQYSISNLPTAQQFPCSHVNQSKQNSRPILTTVIDQSNFDPPVPVQHERKYVTQVEGAKYKKHVIYPNSMELPTYSPGVAVKSKKLVGPFTGVEPPKGAIIIPVRRL